MVRAAYYGTGKAKGRLDSWVCGNTWAAIPVLYHAGWHMGMAELVYRIPQVESVHESIVHLDMAVLVRSESSVRSQSHAQGTKLSLGIEFWAHI